MPRKPIAKQSSKKKPVSKSATLSAPHNRKSTGRKCLCCTHSNVRELNQAVHAGHSFRAISSQFGVGRNSVQRHAENCLTLQIRALIKEKRIANAIDHYQEIAEQLAFAKKLRKEAENYLTNPITGLIDLIPRSDEVYVTYIDYTEKHDGKTVPKTKTATIDSLIAKFAMNVERIEIKHVDMRTFALDAIRTVDMVLDKVAKVQGLYTKDRENQQTLEKVATAFEMWLEDHPEANETDRLFWLVRFARGGGVDKDDLAKRLGMQLPEMPVEKAVNQLVYIEDENEEETEGGYPDDFW